MPYSEASPFRRTWNNYGGVTLDEDAAPPSAASSLATNLAGIYLYLSVYPHTRELVKIGSLDKARSYRDYYSYTSQFTLWLAILALLFLSFVEDGHERWAVSSTLRVEFACLVVLFWKAWHKHTFMGASPPRDAVDNNNDYTTTTIASELQKHKTMQRLHFGVLVVLAADFCATVALLTDSDLHPYYRYLRALRPALVFIHAGSVRLRFIDMMIAGYRAQTMFLLMSFNLVFFSVVGTILFYKTSEGEAYFPDFPTSLVTLIVLQTTSNHPRVIAPAFSDFSRWSELYFVLFLLMSHFLMLNLMLGVIYHELTARLRSAATKELLDSAVALRISMAILQEDDNASSNTTARRQHRRQRFFRPSGAVKYELVAHTIANEFALSLPHVRRLLERCGQPKQTRGSGMASSSPRYRRKVSIDDDDDKEEENGDDDVEFVSPHVFSRIPAVLRLHQSIQDEDDDDDHEEQEEGQKAARSDGQRALHWLRRALTKRISTSASPSSCSSFLSELTYVDAFVVASLLFQLALMVSAMVVNLASYFQDSPTWFDLVGQVLTLCFMVELTLKLMAFGWFRFSDDLWNVFDTVCVALSFVGAFVAEDDKSQQIMAGARLMRLLRVVPAFRSLTGTAAAFAPAVAPSVCAILCIFYSLAIGAVGVLGEYRLKQNEYTANDFRDFVAALVTLFELALVNDWNETMAAFVRATGTRAVQVFFVAWWAISQLLLFNSVTSLVLDGFEVRMRELRAVSEPAAATSTTMTVAGGARSSSLAAGSSRSKIDQLQLYSRMSSSSSSVGNRDVDDDDDDADDDERGGEMSTNNRRRPPPFVKSSSFTVGRMFVELFRNVDEPTEEQVRAACANLGFDV